MLSGFFRWKGLITLLLKNLLLLLLLLENICRTGNVIVHQDTVEFALDLSLPITHQRATDLSFTAVVLCRWPARPVSGLIEYLWGAVVWNTLWHLLCRCYQDMAQHIALFLFWGPTAALLVSYGFYTNWKWIISFSRGHCEVSTFSCFSIYFWPGESSYLYLQLNFRSHVKLYGIYLQACHPIYNCVCLHIPST